MKKKSQKTSLPSRFTFLKSKKTFAIIALLAAAGIVVGFFSFAGNGDSKGRYFSWRQGTVMNDYTIYTRSPRISEDFTLKNLPGLNNCRPTYTLSPGQKVPATLKCATSAEISKATQRKTYTTLQYVKYSENDWNGNYLGVYTEKTTPAFASRDLKVGSVGEDVAVLKRALIAIGEFPVVKGSQTVKAKTIYPAFTKMDSKNLYSFDPSVSEVILALDSAFNTSSYKSTLRDNVINKYEQVRILSMATDPGFNTEKGVVFNASSINLDGSGKVYDVKKMDKNKWYLHLDRLSGMPIVGYFVPKASPSFGSRVMSKDQKGGDVKILQAMLKYVERKHAGHLKFDRLAVNGTFDTATINAVKTFQAYYQLSQTGSVDNLTLVRLAKDLTWPIYNNK